MLTVRRYGQEIKVPAVVDATETPYTYRPFEHDGWYEEPFLRHIRRRDNRGVYVDVGAHLGTHTTWFAMFCPATHVHAVEPLPRFADQIENIVAANDLGERVTVHRVGLADKPGTATNHLSAEHQIGFDPVGEQAVRDETFPVTTLDDLVTDPVAVIKIDVEGMEERVLLGAKRILATDRPTVYVEAFDRELLRAIASVLRPFGYTPTGKIFNGTPTYEFAVTTAVSRVAGPGLLLANNVTRAARKRLGHLLKR